MNEALRIAVFAPQHDTPGKADAREFRGEAARFLRAHGLSQPIILFDNTLPSSQRASRIADALRMRRDLDAVALFCHGTPKSLQTGHSGVAGAEALAMHLARFKDLRAVILYACSTGADNDDDHADDRSPGPGGDGGFADLLRDELAVTFARPVTVFAHTTVGHATQNPHVRRFDAATGTGGEWVIEPGSEMWPAWRQALRGDSGLRFRFPFMTADEIEAELRA